MDQSGWTCFIRVPSVALMMPPPISTTSTVLLLTNAYSTARIHSALRERTARTQESVHGCIDDTPNSESCRFCTPLRCGEDRPNLARKTDLPERDCRFFEAPTVGRREDGDRNRQVGGRFAQLHSPDGRNIYVLLAEFEVY